MWRSRAPAISSWRRHASLSRRQGSTKPEKRDSDVRVSEIGPLLDDEYASLRNSYQAPEHPIVLAHGLFGFESLHLAGPYLPGLQYWRGIMEALRAQKVEVFTVSVPPLATIEERAATLVENIEKKVGGRSVNIIAHSMGGLDSRFMISRLKPPNVRVISLTTIATPHRGSEVADYIYENVPSHHIKRLTNLLKRLGISHGAFAQLTTAHMVDTFNPATPDAPDTRYYSYGASLTRPSIFSPFRRTHRIILESLAPQGREIEREEGGQNPNANDGLVSVRSSRWGIYKGTLLHVSHLDLINWTNRLRWWARSLLWGWQSKRGRPPFNAVAFYCGVCGMLHSTILDFLGSLGTYPLWLKKRAPKPLADSSVSVLDWTSTLLAILANENE